MEKEIYSIIGKNTVYPKETLYNEIYGWEGNVFCIIRGMDIWFNEIPVEDQKAIYQCIKQKNYE